MQRFLDWCVREGELETNPWSTLSIRAKPEVSPHGVLTDAQVSILLKAKDKVLHSALLSDSTFRTDRFWACGG
jgi:site-specific recombinase XerD